jgi:hypothetical protein
MGNGRNHQTSCLSSWAPQKNRFHQKWAIADVDFQWNYHFHSMNSAFLGAQGGASVSRSALLALVSLPLL